MRIFDISVTLREPMPTWPGDDGFRRELTSALQEGDSANVSTLRMGAHAGTHVDAPRHFLETGCAVDEIPPGALVGPCAVIEIRSPDAVTKAELTEHGWDGVERVLLKTANSGELNRRDEFNESFIAIAPDAAEFLASKGIKLVGVDNQSVDAPGSPGHPTHHILLGAGIVIVEGLDLREVPAGRYELLCAPLKIRDGDGAPARVFLRETGPGGD